MESTQKIEIENAELHELIEIAGETWVDKAMPADKKPLPASLSGITIPLSEVMRDSAYYLGRISIELKKIRKILDREMKKAS